MPTKIDSAFTYAMDWAVCYIDSIPGRIFRRKPAPEDYVWSKYDGFHGVFIPKVRLIEGAYSTGLGQLWRKRSESGEWEYTQDPETLDDWQARQL